MQMKCCLIGSSSQMYSSRNSANHVAALQKKWINQCAHSLKDHVTLSSDQWKHFTQWHGFRDLGRRSCVCSCSLPSLRRFTHPSVCHRSTRSYDDISQTYTTLTTAWPTLTPQEAFYSCCYLSVLFYCKCWKGRAGICQKSFRWIRSRHTERGTSWRVYLNSSEQ